MKLSTIAAALVAASCTTGAWAQSECCEYSRKAKEATEVEVVLVADETEACEKVCETTCDEAVEAVATLISDETSECASACSGEKAAAVLASDETSDCASACSGEKAVLASNDECASECTLDKSSKAVLASYPGDMPMFAYVVGDKETMCSVQANEMASACDSLNVAYKVADATYNCKMSAGKAYAAELGTYLDRMTRISFVVGDECVGCPLAANAKCEESGAKMKYKVAGQVFDCPSAAIQASAMAYGMSQHVQMAYQIDGEATSCSKSFAGAKECPVTEAMYVVGKNKTECDIEASVMLMMAKIEAATKAAKMATTDMASNEG